MSSNTPSRSGWAQGVARLKAVWTDSVWSKVIAAGIIGAATMIGVYLVQVVRPEGSQGDPRNLDAAAITPDSEAPSPPRPPPTPLPSLTSLCKQLESRCASKSVVDNTVEIDKQLREEDDCLHKGMVGEVERTTRPLQGATTVLAQALAELQSAFESYVKNMCWVVEESYWVDFDNGTRDDGTMRTWFYLACKKLSYIEYSVFARALSQSDAASMARRVDQFEPRGTRAFEALSWMQVKAERLAHSTVDEHPSAVYILDAKARWELTGRIALVASDPARLARATCSAWPDLSVALGAGRCAHSLELYYAGYAEYAKPDFDGVKFPQNQPCLF